MSQNQPNGKEKFEEFLATHRTKLSDGKLVPTQFYTIQEVKSIFNAEQLQVEKLFRCKGFPVCTLGKSKVVEVHAFLRFWQAHPEIEFGPVQFKTQTERRKKYGNA